LLQNTEDAAGSVMALGTGTYARTADHNPVAINMHLLLRDADKDHEGTLGRNFGMPPVLAGFKRSRRLTGRCAFCVKRRSLHRSLRGSEEANGNDKNGEESHNVKCKRSVIQQNVFHSR